MRFLPKIGVRQALLRALARVLRRVADWAEPAAVTVDRPDDPPADWLERVRKGAPGLLVPASEGGVPEQVANLPKIPSPHGPYEADVPRPAPRRVAEAINSPRQPVRSPAPAVTARPPAQRRPPAVRIAEPRKPEQHDDVVPRVVEVSRQSDVVPAKGGTPQSVPHVDKTPPKTSSSAPMIAESVVPKKPQHITPPVISEPLLRSTAPSPSSRAPAIRIRPVDPPLGHASVPRLPATDVSADATPPGIWPALPAAARPPETRTTPPTASPATVSRLKPPPAWTRWKADRHLEIPHAPASVHAERTIRTAVAPVEDSPNPVRDSMAFPPIDPPPNAWPELPDDPPPSQQEWAGTLERATRIRNLLAEQRGEVPWSG